MSPNFIPKMIVRLWNEMQSTIHWTFACNYACICSWILGQVSRHANIFRRSTGLCFTVVSYLNKRYDYQEVIMRLVITTGQYWLDKISISLIHPVIISTTLLFIISWSINQTLFCSGKHHEGYLVHKELCNTFTNSTNVRAVFTIRNLSSDILLSSLA